MVFLFDDLNMKLGKSLEFAVKDKCYFYRYSNIKRSDFSVIVSEPAICYDLNWKIPEDVNKYYAALKYFRGKGIPVIIYSEIPEEEWNREGCIKGINYDVYFNKYKDSFEDIWSKLHVYLEFSARFQYN